MKPVLLFLSLLLAPQALTRTQILDDFETLSGWSAVTSHGDASKATIATVPGKDGQALQMRFAFIGHMGSAAVEKRFRQPLPRNYQISFDIRGEGPVNNFVIRLMDSLDNVWWVNKSNFAIPHTWTRITLKKYQLPYGWGPSGGGELHVLDRIMFMIDVVEGGSGGVILDNLAIEPLDEGPELIPRVETSTSITGHPPKQSADGKTVFDWQTSGSGDRQWLAFDFQRTAPVGGLVIDWDSRDFATKFSVLMSDDGNTWISSYTANHANGGHSYVFLGESQGRFLKLILEQSSRGSGYKILRCTIKGPEFGFSINDFFGALAAGAPKGLFPKYLLQQQSYWTVVGVAGDTKEALMNEQGMIETDKQNFSLEPFLYIGRKLVTWNDVSVTQTLDKGFLPIPSVQWSTEQGIHLTITACAEGRPGQSVLLTKYRVENRGDSLIQGSLFIAVRPFQVNPPWQTFTIVGGAARIDSMAFDGVLRVNAKRVIPFTRPAACGVAEFDQGHVTEYLKSGRVPPFSAAIDHFGYASGALQYDFALQIGASKEVVIAVPFHREGPTLLPNMDERKAAAYFDSASARVAQLWESKVDNVDIELPPSASAIANTIRSNLAYALINADGPALQPGSRSYERSWLRDGALTSVALLQMGVVDEVRRYLDWYAGYQFPNGMIPCIVEDRGPEPIPEHDSHGEFIYAIAQYFHFTHDTTWLRGKWDHVMRTIRYIQSLRAMRKTPEYENGTPEQRACYGLVPESISHEGYCPKPMHSYWDDFFVLRGLKDAVTIAHVLGQTAAEKEFTAERDDFRNDFYNSMRLAMRNKKIDFIPGCVELGDFSGLSTTVGILPCDELGYIPEPALTHTFDESYKMFVDRKNNQADWGAYLPYEARFIGAYVYMDQKDRALDILEYLMHDRRPAAWNEWAEVVWKNPSAPKNIGDMPHSWAASDFIRSVRTMFAYEREKDDALVVGAGIPESWLNDPRGVCVRHLPTYYGKLDFSLMKRGNRLVADLSGDVAVPEGKIVLKSTAVHEPVSVYGDGKRGKQAREIVIEKLPAHVELEY